MANLGRDGRKHLHLTTVNDPVVPNGYINVFEEGQFTSGDTLYNNGSNYRLRLNLNIADAHGIEQLWVSSDPDLIPDGNYSITNDAPDPLMIEAGTTINFNLNDDTRNVATAQWLCLQGENTEPGIITGLETGPTLSATFSHTFATAGWYTLIANSLQGWPTAFPPVREDTVDSDHSASFSFRVINAPAGPQFIPGTSVTSPGSDPWTNPEDSTDSFNPDSVVNIRLCPPTSIGAGVYFNGTPSTPTDMSLLKFNPGYMNFDGTNNSANTITAANSTMEKLMSIFSGSHITGPSTGGQKGLIPFALTYYRQPSPSDVYIYMVMDDSGSMSGTYRWWLQTATQKFLSELPDGVFLNITYYHTGTIIDEVVTNNTRGKAIPAPAGGGTPIYEKTAVGANAAKSSSRSIKWCISQSDGASSGDSGTAAGVISAAKPSVAMFMFATGGAAEAGMKSISNDPDLSKIGSFFNRATSEDEQVGAFRSLSTMLNKDTAILHCFVSSGPNERYRPMTGALSSGEYTGEIRDMYNSGIHPFSLSI